ncbi:MAG TPA: sigma 54-interacting transcriptional regulator [Spirochaetota bacterium]|nr:sigma 54-interacting transcriptional regulator [Spirochaetota bacterium]
MMNSDCVANIILDSIADGVFTIDMDFRITSLNNAACKILGLESKDEAIGKLCFEIFHANICEHSCALRETMQTGKNIINKTVYIVNKSGEKVTISISTALLKDDQGNIIGGVETFRDISDIETLRKKIESTYSFEDIISKNKEMQQIFSILPDVALSDSSVLIEGPSGSGKELIARAIHSLSRRKEKPFVVVNCGALPENLLESELFGYKTGAFTDAKKDKPGKIAMAEGGTLFLDEIGELPLSMQVKLLRFLQFKEYEPLGDTKPKKANVRIIAATNKNLREEVAAGNFRDDLYYRLNVIGLRLPSLSQRKEDIPLLVEHFIKKYNTLKGKSIEGVSDDAMNILLNYDYPGNIRELENIIEHAFVLCHEAYIKLEHLPAYVYGITPVSTLSLEEMEKTMIKQALARYSNKKDAAAALGIDTSTLWRKIKKYNLE